MPVMAKIASNPGGVGVGLGEGAGVATANMRVRIKLKVKSLKSGAVEVDINSLLNTGFKSEDLEIILPLRVANNMIFEHENKKPLVP